MTNKQFISIIINKCLLFKGDDFDKNIGILLWMLIIAFLTAILGFSWLISLVQGSLSASLAFLNLIVLSLEHGRTNKELFSGFSFHILGACTTIRSLQVFLSSSHGANLFSEGNGLLHKSSVAFFITTTLPSVLWLSRSTKKGQNFNLQTVIGSGKAISSQDVAGVWGVCGHGAHLFHSKL